MTKTIQMMLLTVLALAHPAGVAAQERFEFYGRRGQVVVFADDPLYRAFWRGPARLLTNAILFGTGR